MLNVKQEIWKPVLGFEQFYQVSSTGRISNYRKIMSIQTMNTGYKTIGFNVGGKHYTKLIHRLVAIAFIDNVDSKPEVNHIDGDKSNNSIDNLEWCTSAENKRHALSTGLKIYNIPTRGLKIGSSSKYHNVSFDKARNKWKAGIRVNGKTLCQKRFDTEIEAASHVNWAIDYLGLSGVTKNIV